MSAAGDALLKRRSAGYREMIPWNIFTIPEDVTNLDLMDAINGKLGGVSGFLFSLGEHRAINELAEVGGIGEAAYGAYIALEEVSALMAALHDRIQATGLAEVGGGHG